MALSRNEIKTLLQRLQSSLPLPECATCECHQGFLTQLLIDCGDESGDLIRAAMTDGRKLHECLGCDPCPPADMHAEYLKKRKRPGFSLDIE